MVDKTEEQTKNLLQMFMELFKGVATLGIAATILAPIAYFGMKMFGLIDKDMSFVDWVKEVPGQIKGLFQSMFEKEIKDMSAEELQAKLEEKGLPQELASIIVENRQPFLDALAKSNVDIQELVSNADAGKKLLGNPDVLKNLLSDPTFANALIASIPVKSVRDKLQAADFASFDYTELAKSLQGYDPAKTNLNDLITEKLITPILKAKGASLLNGADLKALMANKEELIATLTDLNDAQPEAKRVSAEQIATTAAFMSKNADKIATILGDEGLEQIAKMISEQKTIPDLTNLTSILTTPEFNQLRDTILTRALKDNQVEDALKSLNFEDLPASAQAPAKLATTLLSLPSDVQGKTNLDVIAEAGKDQATFEAVMGVVAQITGEKNAADVMLTDQQIAQANKIVRDLNADFVEVVVGAQDITTAQMQIAEGIKEKGSLFAVQTALAGAKVGIENNIVNPADPTEGAMDTFLNAKANEVLESARAK